MKQNKMIKNAVILTITSFILRTLGMLIRSYMSGRLSAEGMGLYQLIISIYVLATTIVTAGISTAVIRLITETLAKNEPLAKVKKIMLKSCMLSLVLSVLTAIVFYRLSKPISLFWLKDDRCIKPIQIMVFALPFISISSCIKSYFIAIRKIGLNSISQILEQAVRIFLVFSLLELSSTQGIEKMCLLVIISDMISEVFSCLHLYWCYRKDTCTLSESTGDSFSIRYFFQIAIPVTVNKYLSCILRTIENVLIPTKLAVFTLSKEVALSQFGTLKAMALPLIFFPASFLTAISTLMVPETSEARTLHQQGRISYLIQKTFSFTITCAIVIATIFFAYSEALGSIFYPNTEVGFYIKSLALLIPFMYLESAIAGIMQGLNQQRKVLVYNMIDSIIRITLICILLPKWGVKSFIFIMYLSNITTSSLNAYRVLKVSKTKFQWMNWLIIPTVSAISAYIFCEMIVKGVMINHAIVWILIKISMIVITYVGLLSMFGLLNVKDLLKMRYHHEN